MTSHFQLWNPYRKSFRILGSPFTAYNETRRVLNKKTRNFLAKLKTAGELPKGDILVIEDVVGIYPNIPHSEGLDILKNNMKIILIKKYLQKM